MASARPRTKKNAFLPLLARVKAGVEPKLEALLEESEALSRGYGSEVGEMVAAVRSLSSRGGKRLRPGLCVTGALCVSTDTEWDVLLDAGVALELLQTYFLIHDDWMDEDEERRGGPTAHVMLKKALRSSKLGECGAILAGDHAVALAQAQLGRLAITPTRLRAALLTFAEMQLAAVAGQQLDVVSKTKTPELTYELKTASYTVKGPLKLGAQLAGAPPKVLARLDAFSLPAGIAFQLRDDLIGVFGDPALTGKPRGADLTAGKNTPLVQEGKKRLNGSAQRALISVLGNRKASTRAVEKVVTLLEDCGAKAAVESRIAELRDEALISLEVPGLDTRGATLLEGAVVALTERDA